MTNTTQTLEYLAKRLLFGVLVVFSVTLIVFLLIYLAPGSPVDVILSGAQVTPEIRRQLIQHYHLDEPWYTQYILWLGNLLHGDLGYSFVRQRSVTTLFAERIAITIKIVVMSMLLATAISIPTGIVAGYRHGTRLDHVLTFLSVIGVSIPVFVSGVLSILLFNYYLSVMPSFDPTGSLLAQLKGLFVPSLLLALTIGALMFRLMRSGMRDVMERAYMETSTAMGIPTRKMVVKHAAKNALAPVLTVSGLWIGFLIVYSLVVEKIFGMGGVGSLLIDAVVQNDYPIVMAGVILLATTYVVINIVVDVLYTWVDPRVAFGGDAQ